MFIQMSIHVPNPGHEREVLDALNRMRFAALGTPGLDQVGPWREVGDGRIVGIAMWESRRHWEAAIPMLSDVTSADDPDGLWYAQPPERLLLEDVGVLPPDGLFD
ncbi:hypothetical protein [Agromyces sp. NPDC049794]|uniref:hypothetical protein n=1 Tax=unclassified Agromyces TaxID=2639701 RepID=UPI0033DF90E1